MNKQCTAALGNMAVIWGLIALLLPICGTSLSCNSGWAAFQGSCYKAVQHPYVNNLAAHYCQLAGDSGALAQAQGLEYLQFFNTLQAFNGKEEYWIDQGSWAEASTTAGPEQDHTHPVFPATPSTLCSYVKVQRIQTELCSVKKYLICQAKENTLNCPMGFDNFDKYCFRAITQQANYEDASKFCVLQKSQLAILDSEDKFREAYKSVIGKNQTFLIGATKTEKGITWTNGNSFEPFGISEYTGDSANESCIGILSESETPTIPLWAYVDCNAKTSYICETQPIPTTTTEKPTTKPPPQPPLQCPHGQNWKSHNASGYCFWETTYETDTLNWYQAREFCKEYGGDLASYANEAQEIAGLAGARGHYRGLWMGLKRDQNDILYWSDNSPLNYTNWDYGQPNLRSSSKFCVTHSGSMQGAWELDYCGVRRWFVCKAPMVRNQIIPTHAERKIKCDIKGISLYRNQWYLYENHCYMVHELNRYTWDTARLFCQDNGGLLASVHSFNETNFILTLTSKSPDSDFWIGLSAHGLQSSYIWSDGAPLDFFYWKEGKNDVDGLNSCVYFNKRDGSWDVTHCNRLLGVVCKRGINTTYDFTTTEPTTVMPGSCRNGWYNYGNKCYKPFGTQWSQRVTWNAAKQACKEIGASLVSIHSQGEQDLLTDIIMEETTDLWIGLQSKESGAVFHWSDESRMDYTSWGSGEPHYLSDSDLFISSRSTDLCVIMEYHETSMGKWDDINCGERKGYMCEMMKDPTVKDTYLDPFTCVNITGWYKLGSSCYGFFEKENLSWLEAQRECRKYGADLITYRNLAVPIFVKKKLQLKNSYFWIGVREKTMNKYDTVTGFPMYYTNWRSGQPVAASSLLDNCAATHSDGDWIVRSCKEKLPFICRLNRDTDQEPTTEIQSDTCGGSGGPWYDFGGDQCYMFQLSMRNSWGDAMRYCFKQGGYLASIHSADDINHLKKQTDALLNSIPPRSIHIGLGKKFDGRYAWVDGSPVDYTAWDEDVDPDFHCTAMSMITGKWTTVDCDDAFRGFICSVAKNSSPVEALASNSSSNQNLISNKLAAGGIFGIVICVLVILAVIGITVYYLRPTKQVQPKLLDSESL